jgi:16S rRNA (cytidine1402-2'-O)-methyltransferase
MQGTEPAAGVLYLVGTPIGNLSDLSPRARHVLAHVHVIACEDTRRSGLLLHHLGLRGAEAAPRLVSFHAHNQSRRIPELLEALHSGEAVAVISDAGLPGIRDPGEDLVAAALEAGRTVITIPGPCAITTALVSSGLPCDRFCFEGFLPPKRNQRRERLQQLAQEPRTMVFYEAPHRLLDLLEDLHALLGERPLAVMRELTKRHEQRIGPTISAALEHFRVTPPQGEFTLVLGGCQVRDNESAAEPSSEELRQALDDLVAHGFSRSDAARELAQRTGLPRRQIYALLHQHCDVG